MGRWAMCTRASVHRYLKPIAVHHLQEGGPRRTKGRYTPYMGTSAIHGYIHLLLIKGSGSRNQARMYLCGGRSRSRLWTAGCCRSPHWRSEVPWPLLGIGSSCSSHHASHAAHADHALSRQVSKGCTLVFRHITYLSFQLPVWASLRGVRSSSMWPEGKSISIPFHVHQQPPAKS